MANYRGRSSVSFGALLGLAVVAALLLGAAYIGWRGSRLPLLLIMAVSGGLLLLTRPVYGLPVLVLVALVLPYDIATGTEVTLNLATVMVPVIAAAWIADMLLQGRLRYATSVVNRPLALFLLAGVLSLGIGNALWDPAVPRSARFALVQWAQWGIFALAALAVWLGANLLRERRWLERVTWSFLWLGGGLAIVRLVPGGGALLARAATIAMSRAPFWALLAGLAGGQLLCNRALSARRRTFLWLCLGAVLWYAFVEQREAASNWIGVTATLGVLLWVRYPRLRWPAGALLVALVIAGILFPAVYEFAGGDDEWFLSGGSRMALIGRTLAVSMRNPITGIGPASYRNYAAMEPLRYRAAVWLRPQISSHNNYVDLLAQTGILGLGLFAWVAVALGRAGWEASHRRHHDGFLQGYAAGMTGVWAGALVLMMMADWMLPFVYNIGFPGFQASLLVWLFLGGLLAAQYLQGAIDEQQ